MIDILSGLQASFAIPSHTEWLGLVPIADVPGQHEPRTGEINYTNIYRSLGRPHYNRLNAMEYGPTIDPVASMRESRMDAQQTMAQSQSTG